MEEEQEEEEEKQQQQQLSVLESLNLNNIMLNIINCCVSEAELCVV